MGNNKKQTFTLSDIDSQKSDFGPKGKKIKTEIKSSPRKMSRKANAFKFLKRDMREIDQSDPFGESSNSL